MPLPTSWLVLLGEGSQQSDVSKSVEDITNVSSSLDINNPIEFDTSDARLLVKYPLPDGLINRARVLIRINGDTAYSGNILSITKKPKERIADVIVSDISQELRNEPLDDFGIEKRVRVSKVDDTESGEYPFTNVLAPVSNKSIKNPVSDGSSLSVRDHLATEGHLVNTNISYDEDTLRSEGESLEVNPDVTLKAPYRNKTILFIVKRILDHYKVNNTRVEVDNLEVNDDHFSTNGRVGYDLENEVDAVSYTHLTLPTICSV